MAIRKADPVGKRTIDLRGPDGNAFAIMGTAQSFARQLGWSKDDTKNMIDDMTSGDYEHLIQVFDNHFGSICDLVR